MAEIDLYQVKRCSKCGVPAPLSFFAPAPLSGNRDRRHSHCRECACAATKFYKNRARDAVIAAEPWSKWEHVSREAYLRGFATKHKLQTKYGLSLDAYCDMLEIQKARCAICGNGQEGRNLAVDHCHRSGAVRGLLCDPCNRGIGFFKEEAVRLSSAIAYLAREKGRLL